MKRKNASPADEPFVEWLKKYFALIIAIVLLFGGLYLQFNNPPQDFPGYLLMSIGLVFAGIWTRTGNPRRRR